MSDIEETGATESKGISRRTVTKAMAWAVPVVAVAAAAPAYAASQGVFSSLGTGCKLPGNATATYKGYVFGLTANNTTDQDIIIQIVSATLDGGDLGSIALVNIANPPTCPVDTSPFTIAANTSYPKLALITQNAPNSQNGVLVIQYRSSADNFATIQTFTETVPAVPPITGGGSCTSFNTAEKACIVAATL